MKDNTRLRENEREGRRMMEETGRIETEMGNRRKKSEEKKNIRRNYKC